MTITLRSFSPIIVDRLAELTRYRDRDLLDVTLANAFRDLIQPRAVAIYRKVGDPRDERWATRASLREGEVVARADSVWTPLKSLPRLHEFPARCEAMNGTTVRYQHERGYVAVFPLATDREVCGVLELQTDAPLDGDAQRVVCSILSVYRNFESLLDYSERDTLTGLLNRKTFDETFLKIVSTTPANLLASSAERRTAQPSDPYWVGMIDIDFFKAVNDTYGHLIGDEVLLLQSRLMRSTFRFDDRLYRFGGEEFVALIRCPTADDAACAFGRLRANTAAYDFPQVGRVTISIGFAQVLPGDSPSATLGRADRAVYHAKTHGRNQVLGYEALVLAGEIQSAPQRVGEVDLF